MRVMRPLPRSMLGAGGRNRFTHGGWTPAPARLPGTGLSTGAKAIVLVGGVAGHSRRAVLCSLYGAKELGAAGGRLRRRGCLGCGDADQGGARAGLGGAGGGHAVRARLLRRER